VSEPDRVDSAEQAVAVDPVAAVVEARAVSRVFPMPAGPVTALHEVTMRIGAGEYVAIAGPSGCGKSTLLHVIGCVDTPTSGEVWIDGQAVATLSDAERSRIRLTRIGFVFQRFFLLPMLSALENVELPQAEAGVAKTERRERARELLDYVGLAHRADHRPAQLSGGEMQRVAIARALANRPKLLIADEPTGNLDHKTAEGVFAMLAELVRGGDFGALVATHNLDLAARMDRMLELRDGVLVQH
jgi:lipoprotein-releasing system ATP-binding protein